jgi:DNA invertase Pin-like site-specific DNA recombinase
MSKIDIVGGESPEHWVDRRPIILARVSTSKQRESLPQQVEQMKAELKALGYRKKPVVISIQKSGKAQDLKSLRLVKQALDDAPNTKFVIFVRDTPRLARDLLQALKFLEEMLKRDVPVVPLDLRMTVGPVGTVARMLFSLNAAVAEGGKATEVSARQQRQQQRAEEGVPEGTPKDFYPQKMKKGMTVYDQVWSLKDAVLAGTMSKRAAAKAVDLLPQKSNQIREMLMEIEAQGGPEKVKEYLDVVRAIVRIEKRRGVGSRARKPARERTRRAKALHRVSVGYLQFPFTFPRPDTEGNPLTARPDKQDTAPGTLEDAVENPGDYLPDK